MKTIMRYLLLLLAVTSLQSVCYSVEPIAVELPLPNKPYEIRVSAESPKIQFVLVIHEGKMSVKGWTVDRVAKEIVFKEFPLSEEERSSIEDRLPMFFKADLEERFTKRPPKETAATQIWITISQDEKSISRCIYGIFGDPLPQAAKGFTEKIDLITKGYLPLTLLYQK